MNIRPLASLVCAVLLASSGSAWSEPSHKAVGEKIDSGLGELPPYSEWADPTGRYPYGYKIVGESLDSGLGDLPHYSKWLDRSGRVPLGRVIVRIASIR